MDTLTHSLIGSAVSDGFFRRRLGRLATPFALAVSALPDADAFTYLISVETAWANHRGLTHSLLPMAVAAPILGAGGFLLARRQGTFGLWTLLAALCLCLHTFFDLLTSWGTMPLLPFSNARLSWDILPIIDAFLLAVTAASFAANRLLRRERVDTFTNPLAFPVVHRHPRRQRAGTCCGKAAAALVVIYLGVGWLQHRQTVGYAQEELARAGIAATEVRALPVMFTYLAWYIAARDADGTVYNAVHSSYAPQEMAFLTFPTLSGREREAVSATPQGRMFAWYSQEMYVMEREKRAEGMATVMVDRRFFLLSRPRAARFRVLFPDDGSAAEPGARMIWNGGGDMDVRRELDVLWELMWRGKVNGWPIEP